MKKSLPVITDPRLLMSIVPMQRASDEPVIDEVTKKMTAARRRGVLIVETMGFCRCVCGAQTSSNTYGLGNKSEIPFNGLLIHQLAWHRHEIPANVLEFIRSLEFGEMEPEPNELINPPYQRPKQ